MFKNEDYILLKERIDDNIDFSLLDKFEYSSLLDKKLKL